MTESCRLITEEQYQEWKRADEEIDELTKQLMKVNKLWEQTIKANKMYGRKLDIAIKALKDIEENGTIKDIKTITVLCVNNWLLAHKALKEMEGIK